MSNTSLLTMLRYTRNRQRTTQTPSPKRIHLVVTKSSSDQQQQQELAVPDLLDLGHELAKQGNYESARLHFQHAVTKLENDNSTIETDNNKPSSIHGYQLSAVLSDLGHCCSKLGLHHEASSNWSEALRLKRNYYNYEATAAGKTEKSNKNLDLAQAIENAGKGLMTVGDYNNAKRHYNEALDMKRLVYGKQQQPEAEHQEQHLQPVMPVVVVGKLGMKQQVYGYDRAQNTDVAYSLCKIGELGHLLGKFHSARKRYAEALDMYRLAHCSHRHPLADNTNVKHIDIVKVLAHLGHVHADIGKYRHAITYFDQAETMVQDLLQQLSLTSDNNNKSSNYYSEILRRVRDCREASLRNPKTTTAVVQPLSSSSINVVPQEESAEMMIESI